MGLPHEPLRYDVRNQATTKMGCTQLDLGLHMLGATRCILPSATFLPTSVGGISWHHILWVSGLQKHCNSPPTPCYTILQRQ